MKQFYLIKNEKIIERKDFTVFNCSEAVSFLDEKYNAIISENPNARLLAVGEYSYEVRVGNDVYRLCIYDTYHEAVSGKHPDNLSASRVYGWIPYVNILGGDIVKAYKYLVLIRDKENRDGLKIKKATFCKADNGYECFAEEREGSKGSREHIENVVGYIPLPYYAEYEYDIQN